MRLFHLPTITRKRLLTTAAPFLALLLAGWLGAPLIARRAVDRALGAAGLAPATFEVRSVGLSSVKLVNLSVGTSPWLTAGSVEVSYGVPDLLSGKVGSIAVEDAQWTVRGRDGAIDWGFMPKERTGPGTLDLPFDRLDLRKSAIRVIVDDVMHEVPLAVTLLRAHPDGSIQIDVTAMLESVVQRAGDVEIAISHAGVTGHATLDGTGQVTELTSSIILQNLRAGEVTLRSLELTAVKLDGPQLQLQAVASGENWQLPAAHGTVHWDMNPVSTEESTRSANLTIGMQTSQPVSLNWESSGMTGLVESLAGSMKVGVSGSGLTVTEGSFTMNGASLQVGDLSVSGARAEAVMRSTDAIDVTSFAATVGDGGTISAAPFTFNSREPQIQTRLSMNDLSLAQWLPLLTGDRSTGQGRVSGYADVAIDWTTSTARLDHLSGSLRADPQHGFIQVIDAAALGELLEAQDARFATDEVMRSMRDKIVSALQDFAFNSLSVDLSRRGDETVAQAYVSGFGRHGTDPQGLNVTLNLHVQDAILDLVSRIADRGRIRGAAESRLDRFFDEAPDSDEVNP